MEKYTKELIIEMEQVIQSTLIPIGYKEDHRGKFIVKAPITKARVDRFKEKVIELFLTESEVFSTLIKRELSLLSEKQRAAKSLLDEKSSSLLKRLLYRKQAAELRKAVYTYDRQKEILNKLLGFIS